MKDTSRGKPHSPERSEQARQRKKQRRIELVTAQAPVMNDPDALLHLATVCSVTGLSATTVYDRVRNAGPSRFPAPIRLSARCSRWRCADVRKWLAEQSATAK